MISQCIAVLIIFYLYTTLTLQYTTQERDPSKRVVNGNSADLHEWPWQVSVEKNNRHVCGGSLIKRDWVLTAAHCIEGKDLKYYTVVVGAHFRGGSTKYQERIPIIKAIRHHGYNSVTFVKDVALVELEKPVILSTGVQLIDLPKQGQRAGVGTTCFITGWRRNENQILMNELQEAQLQIDDFDSCSQRMSEVKRIDEESMLCALGKGQGGCRGDSGGPLSCLEDDRWLLRGVVSWGHNCSPDHHTVFARVSSFVDWIETYTICEDKNRFCKHYKGQCKHGYEYLKKHCRGTCSDEFC